MNLKVSLLCSSIQEREALIASLANLPEVEINVHVGDARRLLSVIQKDRPHVVLLNFPTPDPEAFEQIEAATLRVPGVMVLLVSPDASIDLLKSAMEAGVRHILPAPLSKDSVVSAVDYWHKTESLSSRLTDNKGELLAFLNAKGGSGSTFLASNLGYTLAAAGRKVLLVDLNLFFGDMLANVTDRKPGASILDLARQSDLLDAALLESSVLAARENLYVLSAPLFPYHIEILTPKILQKILVLALSHYDFVILDTGRTLDPTTIKALDLSDRIYLVLQLALPAIQNVKRIETVFEGLGYGQNKLHVVVNRYEKNGSIALDELERVTQNKVARTVPASYEAVMASINEGVPLPMLSPRDPVTHLLQAWAADLTPVTLKPKKGWLAALTDGF
ncbi:AAA family ATPase [Rhodoferax sp.]|uniref:AAA family ATPase n=1 Tax=Rhodoferax sp. TaxID=50421 RepID=UPI002729206D|nr:AAA family ATPase [Rhodoferax sp.]MDO9145783.1 AAA family ATPase [Rhodoferax sp.]MDP1527932.1 AAA family ATPase [Rhodoferax sp.]MDP1944455.1 AAA family ATPase [Rhodoferax sp.]MDP2441015.1 AAA family ATPase [Rhodoferax sp.]MDP3192127.1 AAA family ATPase [Rhodoferax sp.]